MHDEFREHCVLVRVDSVWNIASINNTGSVHAEVFWCGPELEYIGLSEYDLPVCWKTEKIVWVPVDLICRRLASFPFCEPSGSTQNHDGS